MVEMLRMVRMDLLLPDQWWKCRLWIGAICISLPSFLTTIVLLQYCTVLYSTVQYCTPLLLTASVLLQYNTVLYSFNSYCYCHSCVTIAWGAPEAEMSRSSIQKHRHTETQKTEILKKKQEIDENYPQFRNTFKNSILTRIKEFNLCRQVTKPHNFNRFV